MKATKKLSATSSKRFKALAKALGDVIIDIDANALTLYVEAQERYEASAATLEKEGRYNRVGVNGALQLHPACSDEKAAIDTMLKLSRRLGLDPESRGKLSLQDNKNAKLPDDGITDLLDGK